MILSFKIPSCNMGTFTHTLSKLQRRAAKLDLPIPTYSKVGEEVKTFVNEHGQEKSMLLILVEVNVGINVIGIEGWTFVATIQHTDEGNIIRNIGTNQLPNDYRQVGASCEHCNTNRYRKDTYVLRNDKDGTYKQVGRNCLSDFLGGRDIQSFCSACEYVQTLESRIRGEESYGHGSAIWEKLEVYLGYVAECIKLNGWLSRTSAKYSGGTATANLAYRHMYPSSNRDCREELLFSSVSAESIKLANEAIVWAESLENEENEYLYNISVIAKRGVCEPRDMGLAASIVSAYQRHLGDIQQKAKNANSEYQGKEGESLTVKVRVNKVTTCSGAYGETYLHSMSDDAGNVYTWFSSGKAFETGSVVTLAGKVKAHKEYKGTKQTVLTRCVEVELKSFSVTIGNACYALLATCESEAKKQFKSQLGLARWPKGVNVVMGDCA